MEVEKEDDKDVLVIDAASSTAGYHRWPYSRLRSREHPMLSEMEFSGSWTEKLHVMAEKLKKWLLQRKWKKILEIFSLSCIVLMIWLVYAIPTSFYLIGQKAGQTNEVCHDIII